MNKQIILRCLVVVAITLPIVIIMAAFLRQDVGYEGKPEKVWFEKLMPLQSSPELAAFQKMGKKALPMLEGKIKSSKLPNERYKAVWILGQLGDIGISSMPSLVQALADDNNSVRYYAIDSLSRIGPNPSDQNLINALIARIDDENKSISASAVELLNKIEEERKIRNLPPIYSNDLDYATALTKSVSPQVQLIGVDRLGAVAGNDNNVRIILESLLQSTNQSVRAHADMFLASRFNKQN